MAKETNFEHPPRGHVALLAYDPVNDRFQAVHVDASGNLQVDVTAIVDGQIHLYGWDGDSWEKLQVDANKYLKVTLPIEEALGARAYHYDGSNWRRSNLLWGYHDVAAENLDDSSLAAGANSIFSTEVPAGEVHVISAILGAVTSATITDLTHSLYVNSVYVHTFKYAPPTSGTQYLQTGTFILGPGDKMRWYVAGATAGDSLIARYAGYKMDINM